MKKPLRSNFVPGTTRWAVRRAQWKALGLTDADFEKPKIAIVNTSSELSSCFSHLDGITPKIKEAIRAAGGVPFEVRTMAPSDFITAAAKGARYILPSRDLIASDIEVAVEGALLDGMILLASCDKTTPGQLMAAARINIPSRAACRSRTSPACATSRCRAPACARAWARPTPCTSSARRSA
jgi:dihydroxy-acid dehydratase